MSLVEVFLQIRDGDDTGFVRSLAAESFKRVCTSDTSVIFIHPEDTAPCSRRPLRTPGKIRAIGSASNKQVPFSMFRID